MKDPPLPRLRPVEAFPVEEDGQTRLCIRDPQRLSEKVLLLSPQAYFLAACLDGASTARTVANAFELRYGLKVEKEEIENVVRGLDEALLLDSPRFQRHLRRERAAFGRLRVRPAALAGSAYPGGAGPLTEELEGYSAAPGPGAETFAPNGPLRGIVSPHIDFARGGHAYAWSYREIAARKPAELYVILGVAHAGAPVPFALSTKDYATPLGSVPTDRTFARKLCKAAPYDLLEHELSHRAEHSIEFQAVWLRHSTGPKAPRILPILCTHLAAPENIETEEVLSALAERLRPVRDRTVLVAGVDLSHVGPRFGDPEPVKNLLGWMEASDRAAVERLLAGDPEGFHGAASIDDGKLKVCGLGALYAFGRLMNAVWPEARGRLHRYDHKPDPAGGEVSFFSAAWTDPS